MIQITEMMMALLTIPIQIDEDKLRELIAEAVEKLKAEGWIWRDKNGELLAIENGKSTGCDKPEES